ncbi:Ribosomal large subunit pseudouridine synthase E, partial [Haemophilus influenzae]
RAKFMGTQSTYPRTEKYSHKLVRN